jgi:hypothetical protein
VKKPIALFLLGVLFGAVSMNTYLAGRLDALYIEREKLKIDLYQTTERLKKIEAQWQSSRTPVIREISVQFAGETADPFLAMALRQAVTKLTGDLVGEKLDTLSASLAIHLLDKRIVEADNNRYRLYVKTLIVSEKLTYILDYEPVTVPEVGEP